MILRNTSATIETTLTVDGEGTDPAPDEATVAIFRENGDELVAETDATNGDDGLFSFQLTPVHTSQVDVLRAVWKMSLGGNEQTLETYHEIVGGFMCSLAEIRGALIKPPAEPSAADLRAARDYAEGFLEDRCNVAFRPRYARDALVGNGRRSMLLRRPRPLSILNATLDGTDVTADLSLSVGGTVTRAAGFTCGAELVITYEHGWPAPPPGAGRITAKLGRHVLQPDPKNWDERAGRIEIDQDTVYDFLTRPGVNGAETSIPEVNEFISRHRYRTVG